MSSRLNGMLMYRSVPTYTQNLSFTELINAGIKLSDEHTLCKFQRYKSQLQCLSHKKTLINNMTDFEIGNVQALAPKIVKLSLEEQRAKILAIRNTK